MPPSNAPVRLRKDLGLFGVYALATGATLSSGLFLLPGLAASQAGPAIVLCYLIAAIPLVPAMFSIVELATAMPRAGGAYYFLDRSLGPLAGTIGGLGTWFALMLKTAFALVGMGAYVKLLLPDAPHVLVAAGLAIVFGVVNLVGARGIGSFQAVLVVGLLSCLAWFCGIGLPSIDPSHFAGFFDAGFESIASTAGLVYISYVGVTNVASVSEEVRDPERNLPRGVFLALGSAVAIYAMCTAVMVGVVPLDVLQGHLTPMAEAAGRLAGRSGVLLVSGAALMAFASIANAGIMSASRYPLAMSRDHLLPSAFRRLSTRGTPAVSVLTTVAIILVMLVLLDPMKMAKLASAFQLLMFACLCAAVIVMRESGLASYDPGYRSPWYPWMQIAGVIGAFSLLSAMGWVPQLFTLGLITASTAWYFHYARDQVVRRGAIYHVFERLGRERFGALDRELRGILMEKGLREADPFEEVVSRAFIIDSVRGQSFDDLVAEASRLLAQRVPGHAEDLTKGFLDGNVTGATPVTNGVALPHLRLPGLSAPEMVLVRSRTGITVTTGHVFDDGSTTDTMEAIFFLVSDDADPGQHLRLLAQLASRVGEDDFLATWTDAAGAEEIKGVLLRNEHYLSLPIRGNAAAAAFVGRQLRDLDLPSGCLVTMVRRAGQTIVPHGETVIHESDVLTIIGDPPAIDSLRSTYTATSTAAPTGG